MGTLNWARGHFCDDRSRNLPGSREAASGAFTTSGTQASVTGLTPKDGEVIRFSAATSHWVRFGNRAAAVGTGWHVPANSIVEFEVDDEDAGLPVSAIEG